MSQLHNTQLYDGYRYKITDLIEATKDFEVFEIRVADIFLDYQAPNDNTLHDFIKHCKRMVNADLKYPIILSPCNFILDGKHRVARAILEEEEFIKAVRFREMPDCGEYEE